MPLSWNEIRNNALAFSKEWEREQRRRTRRPSPSRTPSPVCSALPRRRVASFEEPVTKLVIGRGGYIDLLWRRGVLLVEHKSRGKDLDRAFRQAKDYFQGLKERDLPKYVLVSRLRKVPLVRPG